MDEMQKGRVRLTKRNRGDHAGPPVAYLNNKSHTGNNTLKRSPSDASYFNQQGLGRIPPAGAALSATTTPGASPQLRRSPSLLTPVHEQQQQQQQHAGYSSYSYANQHQNHPAAATTTAASASSFAHLPPASVGAPFNAAIVEEALHASTTAGPRRPSPPQHSYTYAADQSAKYRVPKLRQSASFTALARKMDTPPSGTKSPRSNRYSDEGDAAKKRHSGGGKKKGTFSNFMSSLVSSPRRPTISTPTNPMHVTHVSIDNETGEFTVRGPPSTLFCTMCCSPSIWLCSRPCHRPLTPPLLPR